MCDKRLNNGVTDMNASPAYIAAYEAHNAALEIFQIALKKFRAIPGIASEADYAEFAAAQAAKKIADAAFDAAYNAECERDAEVVEEVEDDSQMEFAL